MGPRRGRTRDGGRREYAEQPFPGEPAGSMAVVRVSHGEHHHLSRSAERGPARGPSWPGVVAHGLVLALLLAGCTTSERSNAAGRDTPISTVGDNSTGAAESSASSAPRGSSAPTRNEGDGALIDAAWANDLEQARQLIAAGADVNAQDASRQSAYLIATSEGHLALLELFLAHGADVAALDSYRGTGLIRAAERGHADIVGRLLRSGIDVNHVNNLGWTALHEAVILGNGSERYVDTVRLLVAGGADVGLAAAEDGIAALEHAEARQQQRVAATLRAAVAAPALPTPADAARQLLDAAAAGDADRAALALRAGAGIETRDGNQRSPLLLAAAADHVETARLLVRLGADPDALDEAHDTPWLVTGVTGSVAMAELLLGAGADLTITNRFGGLSIIPASERGHVAYVRRVATSGINVNHVNNLGWTALLEAVILGDGSEPYQQIVRILIDAGADRTIADFDGTSALDHARRRNHDAVAAILSRP